ncbi:MAG TPA: hypothetical protein VHV27_03960 [Phenylobacterium sp.]|jgi:hypothetical protein|nr:hypothetical protein [Phenylobacterium sp.]
MNRSSFAKGVAAAAAGAMALGVAGVAAQAQPYPAPAPGYVTCQQQAHSNGLLGAIIGGGIGAVLGSNVAANHHRSDGGLVGGGVGALLGAHVGASSTACSHPAYAAAPPPPPLAYAAPPVAYAPPPPVGYYPAPPPPRFAYGYRGERLRIAREVGPDGCTLAESPVYLPDGRVERRFVRACVGPDGLFHVVG